MLVVGLVTSAVAASGSLLGTASAVAPVQSIWVSTNVQTSNSQTILVDVSCGAPGDCGAIGVEQPNNGNQYAFYMSETNGSWGSEHAITNNGNGSIMNAISCASAGNCTAVGQYNDYSTGSLVQAPLRVSEVNGVWQSPEFLPPVPGANYYRMGVISCPTAGDCVAIGSFTSPGPSIAFTETNGVWDSGVALPAPDGATYTNPSSVSCVDAGECTVLGSSGGSGGGSTVYVITESSGSWGAAATVPIPGAYYSYPTGHLSCVSAGNCQTAAFYYPPDFSTYGSLSVSETDGVWSTSTLSTPSGQPLQLFYADCVSAGNCYGLAVVPSSGASGMITKTGGVWDTSVANVALPPDASGAPQWRGLSCPAPGRCTVAGNYTYYNPNYNYGSFLSDQIVPSTPGAPTALNTTPSHHQVTLSWTAPTANGGSAITGYKVYASTTAGGEDDTAAPACSTSGATTCTATGLDNDTAYYFTVEATNSVGNSAPSSEVSATPFGLSQQIAFTSTPPGIVSVGDTYSPTTTGGGSGNDVTFSVDDATTNSACSVSGGDVSLDHHGTCVIDADQAGDADFEAAPTVTQSMSVSKGAQSVTFTTTAPDGAAVGDVYDVGTSGTPGSGKPVVVTVDPATTHNACSLVSGGVSLNHAGVCVLDANQTGNADYWAADTASQEIAVGQGVQAVNFTTDPPSDPRVGGSYHPAADGSPTGNPVSISIDGATTNDACSISSGTVSFDHVGDCVIDANQAGSTDYSAAPTNQQLLTIGKAGQVIAFTSTAPTGPSFGEHYTVAATGGSSGNLVVYSVDDATTNNACSITGNDVSLDQPGDCVIDASQAGNDDYQAADTQSQTIAMSAVPTIASISPNSGSAAKATAITINGSGFAGPASVTIGQGSRGPALHASHVVVVSPTQLTATVPAGAWPGRFRVAVRTPGYISAPSDSAWFTFVAQRPTVSAVSPHSGPVAGGTPITITGTGFVSPATVTIAQGSGNPPVTATDVTVVSSTTITAVTPAGAAGRFNVQVQTHSGTSAANSNGQFTYQVVRPTVTSVSPNSGPRAGGTTITITGTGFTSSSAVVIGQGGNPSVTAAVVSVSPTQITAITPAGVAGRFDLHVNTAGGSSLATAADKFRFI